MTLTEEIEHEFALVHGCGAKSPCRDCKDGAKTVKKKIAMAIHIERTEGQVDTFYAGMIRARGIALNGADL